MNLAIFDLDHTLIASDSDNEWPKYLMHKGIVDKAFVEKKNDYFYQQYLQGRLNVDEFLEFQLEPLTHYSMEQLAVMHEEFMCEFIRPTITEVARELVAKHQRAGDDLLLISATNEFIITPIANEFGITEVIGVTLEIGVDGRYTGNYIGVPSYQGGKIVRLEQWLQEKGKTRSDYDDIYFYSDSRNDLPLLQDVSRPVAVNPDDILLAHATEHGWEIVHTH
ncbi:MULTISPECIES: HAD family hydrolase [Vitreoscilla]|uniref:HAD-IB family hydrolase n=1 Tax=Vitreoscilla stercoraria TaxID=61 RepID=A0ABY4E8T5_VITST|nr:MULTISPECIES: HAD family hydrolase [Vitreoscilla]AUZ04435.1 IB family HAD hydrolase [Vitreoscilla sp. C1]UOO91844.1 HAD-IB family hydrolase [Vitreoscilla stercoraria]